MSVFVIPIKQITASHNIKKTFCLLKTDKRLVNTEIMQMIISVSKCGIQEYPDDTALRCNLSPEGTNERKYIASHEKALTYIHLFYSPLSVPQR